MSSPGQASAGPLKQLEDAGHRGHVLLKQRVNACQAARELCNSNVKKMGTHLLHGHLTSLELLDVSLPFHLCLQLCERQVEEEFTQLLQMDERQDCETAIQSLCDRYIPLRSILDFSQGTAFDGKGPVLQAIVGGAQKQS